MRGSGKRTSWVPWVLLIVLGGATITWHWWQSVLQAPLSAFLNASLADQARYAGLVGPLISFVSMLVGFAGLARTIMKDRRPAAEESEAAERFRPGEAPARLASLLSDAPRMGHRRIRPDLLRVHASIRSPDVELEVGRGTVGEPQGRRRTWPWRERSRRAARKHYLPLFVVRDQMSEVCGWMRTARDAGGFLVLIGNSSVGKTRLLYEAARQVLPDYVVLAPELGDGAVVNALAESTKRIPKILVWLDELQRYLPGPYLTPGATPLSPAAVRRLSANRRMILLGTSWPEYDSELRAVKADPSTGLPTAVHPDAMDILDARNIQYISVSSFSADEREAARSLAKLDSRLAIALSDESYNVTEVLAGAPEIVRRYEDGTEEHHAVVEAAVDAYRVGVRAVLSEELLLQAARGYLRTRHADDFWFVVALAEVSRHDRPRDRATAPLIEHLSSDRKSAVGYTVSDYLLQRLIHERRTARVPATAWESFVANLEGADDLARVAKSATDRMLYTYGEGLLRRCVSAGSEIAGYQLAALLRQQGRQAELQALAEAGDEVATAGLIGLLGEQEREEDLSELAKAGNVEAAFRLADLQSDRGNYEGAIASLRPLAQSGNSVAIYQMTDLLRRESNEDALRSLASSGHEAAGYRLADLLRAQDRHEEALDILRRLAADGDQHAAFAMAGLLREQDRYDEAIAVLESLADEGYQYATTLLVGVLREHGREQELRNLRGEAVYGLAELLCEQGRYDEAIEILKPLAETYPHAAFLLADLFLKQDRSDDAAQILLPHAGTGDSLAACCLVSLLQKQGREGELRQLSEAGSQRAASSLASLLQHQGREAELRELATAGNEAATFRLAELLRDRGRYNEATSLLLELVGAGAHDARHYLLHHLSLRPDHSEMHDHLKRFGLTPDGQIVQESAADGRATQQPNGSSE